MGREYKKRVKELQGRPTVLGRDVFLGNATSLSGTINNQVLLSTANGIGTHFLARRASLDFVSFEIDTAEAAGPDVALWSNTGLLASGTLDSLQGHMFTWSEDQGNARVLASGSTLTMRYTVGTALDTNRALQGRVGITYLEA
jgi:hypothetical protein